MNTVDLLPCGLDLGYGRQHVNALYFGINDCPVFGCPEHECYRPYEVIDLAIVKVFHYSNNGHLASIHFEITECYFLPDCFLGVGVSYVKSFYQLLVNDYFRGGVRSSRSSNKISSGNELVSL